MHEFLEFAADAGMGLDGPERASWRPLIDKLSDAMEGLNLKRAEHRLGQDEWRGRIRRSLHADTSGHAPEAATSLPTTDPRQAYLLWRTSCFTCCRERILGCGMLYALLGFRTVRDFEYPDELEERRISNPDAFEYYTH